MAAADNGLLLAIDCSLRLTCAAVGEAGPGGSFRLLASEAQDLGRRQAAELPLMAERLLAGRPWSDVRLLAVTNGPGYFTGIRVGASYAAALAYGLGARMVPVSSLEMLAASWPGFGKRPVLAVVYAGRNALYAASFGERAGLPQREYPAAELARWLASQGGMAVISDDPQRAQEAGGLDFAGIQAVRPDPAKLAELAWARRESAISPMELRIAYCRAPQGL